MKKDREPGIGEERKKFYNQKKGSTNKKKMNKQIK